MVLAIAIELVVEGAQIGVDGKLGIEREHAANMPGGAGLIAKHGRTRRKESIVELVGATYAPERVGRIGVATGDEERSAEMAPEAFRMIGVEAHRLPDQLDALLGATGPSVQLALLHDDEIVIGIEADGALLMIFCGLVIAAGEVQSRQNSMYVAIVIVKG